MSRLGRHLRLLADQAEDLMNAGPPPPDGTSEVRHRFSNSATSFGGKLIVQVARDQVGIGGNQARSCSEPSACAAGSRGETRLRPTLFANGLSATSCRSHAPRLGESVSSSQAEQGSSRSVLNRRFSPRVSASVMILEAGGPPGLRDLSQAKSVRKHPRFDGKRRPLRNRSVVDRLKLIVGS